MQCDICYRPGSSRLPLLCVLCSRNALYQQRIQLAHTLLERENIGKEAERDTVKGSKHDKSAISRGPRSVDPQPNTLWTVQRAAAEETLSKGNKDLALLHSQLLREEIDKIKDEIARRKARFRLRRSEFTSARNELLQSQKNGVALVEKSTQKIEYRWDVMHRKTAESRLFLSREAALLCGLEQRRRKKGGLGRDVYYIGGVPIPDLRDLNNAPPAQVTTSATNLAHLVHLVSHYLSLRLPAEIVLPHRDYPFPTMFSPSSSYNGHDIPFPGSTPSHSLNSSPLASRHTEQHSLPRPRPLHLLRKLSTLAKEDQIAYASFVEGITFLAWDISWLCKTQGMNVGDNSWEDVCAMGKNLWELLLAPLAHPPLIREASKLTIPRKTVPSQAPNGKPRPLTLERPQETPPPGYFSHGTVHGFLAAAAGNEYMRHWRIQSPIKVIEKVKAMLQSERTGAEWEILEGNEWEVEDHEADPKKEPDLVNRFAIEGTGVLVKPEADVDQRGEKNESIGKDEGEGKARSTSGWMKLKNR